MKRLILWVLLGGILAACSNEGCVSSESLTVIYRGKAAPEAKAAVIRAGMPEGYVKSIHADEAILRVVLSVKQAAIFTDKDRFQLKKDEAGRMGFDVEPGAGVALKPGAEVEADPSWSIRKQLASTHAPGGITLPSGAFIRYPRELTRETKSTDDRHREDFAKKIGQELRKPKGFEVKVDRRLVNQYDALSERITDKQPEEALEILRAEAPALLAALEAERELAENQNDRQRERDAGNLHKRVARTLEKTEREVKRLEKRAARPERERWVPPELR